MHDDATSNSVFKALADPTRRQILQDLVPGELPAGEIAAHFPISGPSVSRHLSVLRAAGLVNERKDANKVMYSLARERLSECVGLFLSALYPDGSSPEERPSTKKQPKGAHKDRGKHKRKLATEPVTPPRAAPGGPKARSRQPDSAVEPAATEGRRQVGAPGAARPDPPQAPRQPARNPIATSPHPYLQRPGPGHSTPSA